MAILKSVVQVNNGNTGWTRTNVLNALEDTFTNLGFHGGSQTNGVVCTALPPGSDSSHNTSFPDSAWANCGGGQSGGNATYLSPRQFYYTVTASGSTYLMQQFLLTSNVNYSVADAFYFSPALSTIATGDPLVYSATATVNISGGGSLVNGTTYYAIVDNETTLRLATTAQNAAAGTAIDITNNYSGNITVTFTIGSPLQNPNLTVRQSDVVNFSMNAAGHPLFIQDTAGAYNSARVLNNTNYRAITYRGFPTNQGSTSLSINFPTYGWQQGNYYYVSQNDPSLTGTITVLPNTYTQISSDAVNNRSMELPYWDYTVPPSGLRSSLQVRVYRFPRNYGSERAIAGVKILSVNTAGWSTNEVFTIPGNQIGGTTPASDLIFGVNNASTPSIVTTNLGAGSNFYQKFTNQSKAILKVVNDAAKTYGTTYYGFSFGANNQQLRIASGSSWEHLNWNPASSTSSNSGTFGGVVGLDFSTNFNTSFSFDSGDTAGIFSYATSSTPTAYPLKIITYRAQAPQDTNFAIIQFVQTINAVDVPYFTFFLHKGTNYGSGIWDLNHVWQGCYTSIYPFSTGGESIGLDTYAPSRQNTSEGLNTLNATKRESFYGYYRDANDSVDSITSHYIRGNLYADNTSGLDVIYYRNNQYDRVTFAQSFSSALNVNDFVTTYSVSSSANFYKPIKGIPLSTSIPCPYYLPDDFVVIPFVVSPGLTQFRPGDTITVSVSEVYEIVTASFTTNQTTFDGVANNTSRGIAFCARTT